MNAKTYLIITHSQKIYNVVSKIKRNRTQGRNTVEEVLRLSAERGYTVFYRNGEDNNLLKISIGPISNVWDVRRLIKGVIHLVLPDDPCQPLSTHTPPPRDRSHEGTTEDEFHQKG
ncbi:hypothetical protein M9H77_18641 [Catharanthus roseus]|uniref:Uncharacterized protein n=1 Tax=Catharanthus roseus TaxID=4058 RepID=A0ACC0B8A0_CATRO|nr:hypothetical protein M9H77_18641 [Catharanthus roseus]